MEFNDLCKLIVGSQKIVVPKKLSLQQKDLAEKLLERDPAQRLGCERRVGTVAIRNHPMFETFSFEKLAKEKLKPPWTPKLKSQLDCSNFEYQPSSDEPRDEAYDGEKGWIDAFLDNNGGTAL